MEGEKVFIPLSAERHFFILEGEESTGELFIPYGAYWISSFGRVFTTKRGRFLKPYSGNRGYLEVNLAGKQKSLAGLVLECFRGPALGRRANFLDGNIGNVKLNNLEWR